MDVNAKLDGLSSELAIEQYKSKTIEEENKTA